MHHSSEVSETTSTAELAKLVAALQSANERAGNLARLLDIFPNGCITIDSEYRITYINAFALRDNLLEGDQLGKTIWEAIPEYGQSEVGSRIRAVMANRFPEEFRHTDHDQSGKAVRSLYFIYPEDSQLGLHVVYGDINKKGQAQEKLKQSVSLLSAIVNGTSNIVLAKDLRRTYVLANSAAAAFFGLASPDQLVGHQDSEFFDDDGYDSLFQRVKRFDDLVFLSGEDITYEAIDPGSRLKGMYRVLLTTKSPLRDPITGEIFGLVSISYDITERKLREGRDRFLLDLIERTSVLHDRDEIISAMLNSICSFMCASKCVYADIGTSNLIVLARYESIRGSWSMTKELMPGSTVSSTTEQYVRNGMPLILNSIEDERLTEDDRQFLQSRNINAMVSIPVNQKGVTIGLLCVYDDAARAWSAEDIEMLKLLSDRTSLTLENLRLFRELEASEARQRRIADMLQTSMILPQNIHSYPGIQLDSHYEVALDEADVGGDFGDAFYVDKDRIAVLVGDCAGKGLEAARFVSECQFTLRAFLRSFPDSPSQALTKLNQMLLLGQQFEERPLSALTCMSVAVLDCRTGHAIVAASGLEPPLLIRSASGKALPIPAEGSVIGADHIVSFNEVEVDLEVDDMIILTTDGALEARHPETRETFGHARLIQAAEQTATATPAVKGFARSLVAKAKEFAGGVLTDDTCVIVVQRKGIEPLAA